MHDAKPRFPRPFRQKQIPSNDLQSSRIARGDKNSSRMKNSKPRLLLGAVALVLLVAGGTYVYTQIQSRSGSPLKPGNIQTSEHGATIYHLQDGWLIEGAQKEDGTIADKTWLVLIANRVEGTRFNVFSERVEWTTNAPFVEWNSEDRKARVSGNTEWGAIIKGEFRDSNIEGTRWLSGVNVTEPRMVTGMLIDNDVLASVRKDPSKHSAYDLYELRGPKVERPTP